MPVIYFTVTNDLSYDQRMIRICGSLANAGYKVVLVGRSRKNSVKLQQHNFGQKRLFCIFETGKLFYIEFNLRLFLYLLFKKMDGICAIDLDTILPCYLVSRIKKIKRIYDAHELFCEMEEIVSRPKIYKIWKWIEKQTVPKFHFGYTVNEPIASEFFRMYSRNYEVIRSIASYQYYNLQRENFIIYQGAVNEGRSFETLIPAMKFVDHRLYVCGDGNFMQKAKQLVIDHNLQNKVLFKGMLQPDDLVLFSNKAKVGITLFTKSALSNYYSLANRFFDYIQAGTPQICVSYPVYKQMNEQYKVAILIDNLSPENIAKQINQLLHDPIKWDNIHQNCRKAAKELNWENEEIKLLSFYQKVFG